MSQKRNALYELDINDLVTEEEYNSLKEDRSISEEIVDYIDDKKSKAS